MAIAKLAQALQLRGFLITLKEDHIYFSKGNHHTDLVELQQVLETLNIRTAIVDSKIYLLDDDIDQSLLEKLVWYHARNHEVELTHYLESWRYFVKRRHGKKISTLSLETGVARLVKALSAAGIITIMSCDGHGRSAPMIYFGGQHNAMWFQTLLKCGIDTHHFNFHNNWKVEQQRVIHHVLTAETPNKTVDAIADTREQWNLQYILEDTNQIADYFLENTDYFTSLKKNLFNKSDKAHIRRMTDEQLYRWMHTKHQKQTFVS